MELVCYGVELLVCLCSLTLPSPIFNDGKYELRIANMFTDEAHSDCIDASNKSNLWCICIPIFETTNSKWAKWAVKPYAIRMLADSFELTHISPAKTNQYVRNDCQRHFYWWWWFCVYMRMYSFIENSIDRIFAHTHTPEAMWHWFELKATEKEKPPHTYTLTLGHIRWRWFHTIAAIHLIKKPLNAMRNYVFPPRASNA